MTRKHFWQTLPNDSVPLQSLFCRFIVVILVMMESDCKYPDQLIRALSRNRTTPTELIHLISEWIIEPSKMNMNQLIECRDSATNIWRALCADRIRWLIDECSFHERATIEFVPSDRMFVLDLLEAFNKSQNTRQLDRMSSSYVQIILDILVTAKKAKDGNTDVYRSIIVRGPRVYFHIQNESLTIYNYDWRAPPGYFIRNIRVGWYQEGYKVHNVIAL